LAKLADIDDTQHWELTGEAKEGETARSQVVNMRPADRLKNSVKKLNSSFNKERKSLKGQVLAFWFAKDIFALQLENERLRKENDILEKKIVHLHCQVLAED